jgi:phospholipid/cholesterol/gamma-HCH transport system substrate-binding protein
VNRVQRIRLAAFAVIATASVIFAGIEYVGIPQRYLGQSYTVSVNLPDSGGIFSNAEVAMRGVAVGRVHSIHLTPGGVRVDLQIDSDVRIPRDTHVEVANLSAVGEQYVNLLPQQDGGPYLAEGQALPVQAATTPPKVTALLVRLNRLATSIGKPQLRTVVHELGLAFDDSGQDLQTMIDQAHVLTERLAKVQPRTTRLLNDGGRVLRTQAELSGAVRRLSDGMDTFTSTLARQDATLRRMMDRGPGALNQATGFIRDNQADVAMLLPNLTTVSRIMAAPIRLRAINTQLVLLPRIVQGTFNIQPGDGYARLGAVVDNSMAVCMRGYESSGAPPTQPSQLSERPGNPQLRANLNAYCAEPPSSGIGVRGAANVPRPPGDDTERPEPQPNPRGYGPDSSFAESDNHRWQSPESRAGDNHPRGTAQPSSVRMLPPTGLRGLLLKEGTT